MKIERCMDDAWTIYGRHKIDTWTIYSRYGQYIDDLYRVDMAIYGRHLDDIWTILGAIWTIHTICGELIDEVWTISGRHVIYSRCISEMDDM